MKITKEYLETHGIKVEVATLHGSGQFPILGAVDKTIHKTKAGFVAAEFTLIPQGLYIQTKEGHEFIVPSAALNVVQIHNGKTDKIAKTK